MNILTDEQISNIYHSTMEWNEMDYVKAICEAQARLTLQEVGEWLEREGLELTWDNSQGFEDVLKWEGTEGRLVFVSKAMIEALKRGEMPE